MEGEKSCLTSFPNQQEEPHGAGKVDDERNRISRVPQQIYNAEERSVDFRLQPTILHRWRIEDRMRWRRVCACGGSNERCRETPGYPDKQETEDVTKSGWLGLR